MRLKGSLEIRYEGEHGMARSCASAGRVLSSVAARIIESEQDGRNRLSARASVLEGFDYIPVPFRTIEAALPFSPQS